MQVIEPARGQTVSLMPPIYRPTPRYISPQVIEPARGQTVSLMAHDAVNNCLLTAGTTRLTNPSPNPNPNPKPNPNPSPKPYP